MAETSHHQDGFYSTNIIGQQICPHGNYAKILKNHFFLLDPIYLQSVIIHLANGGKGEGCLVEEY
jgi:hypothetical protein